MKNIRESRGFTIVELLLIIGISSILVSLVTINLLKVQHNISLSGAIDTLITDMKGQQVKAMHGASNGSASDSYGISFQGTKYVLYNSTTGPTASDNPSISLETNISIYSTTFTGNNVVFSKGTGEICASTCTNTIVIKNTAGVEQATITINRYGVVTNVN